MKMRRNLKLQPGFTLIELTIAMTLMALIATILYGGFYLSNRAVEKSQARSEESQKLRSGEDLLATYVRSAYPYRSSPRNSSIFFSGEEDGLTFISALSLGMGGRGMAEVSISLGREEDGAGILILEEKTPVRLEDEEKGTGFKNSVVLRKGVSRIRLEYLDSNRNEESWVEQWDGGERRTLPRAVRLSVQEEGGKEIEWIFPIMMSVLAS